MTGCGDSLCVIQKPVGQCTNGGCRCSTQKLKQFIYKLQSDLAAAQGRAEIAENHVKQLEAINQALLEPPSTDEIVCEQRNRIETLRDDLRESNQRVTELEGENEKLKTFLAPIFSVFQLLRGDEPAPTPWEGGCNEPLE